MPTVPDILAGLGALLAEGNSIAGEQGNVELLDEKFERWSRRVHGTLSSWGIGDEGNRFTGTRFTNQLGDSLHVKLLRKAEARLRALRVFRGDFAAHPEFYENQFTPEPTVEARPIPSPKPDKIFLGHGGNALWSKVHIHLKDELRLDVQAWESESRASKYPVGCVEAVVGFLHFRSARSNWRRALIVCGCSRV